LEELWLPQRHGPNGKFFKGLIQLAGAFVHLQKSRPGPSAALFRLAESNLREYPAIHEGLDLGKVLAAIEEWLQRLGKHDREKPLMIGNDSPRLELVSDSMAVHN
jgi:hypothetical protein